MVLRVLTNAYDPLRVVEGEAYSVVFDGFSATYSGIALAPVISGSKVVNILKFLWNWARLWVSGR